MIEFRGVYKQFDDEVVLKDVSFKINPGETKIILVKADPANPRS